MLCLEVPCLYLRPVGEPIHGDAPVLFRRGIDGGIHLHAALSLCHRQLGGILRSVDAHVALYADAARYLHLPIQGRIEQGGHKAQVIGTCLQVGIQFQTVHVREMGGTARRLQLEGCGKAQFDTREREILQVSPHGRVHAQRVIRPVGTHLLGQSVCEKEQVGTSHGTMYLCRQLAGIPVVEGVQIHVERRLKTGCGGLEI